MNAAELARPAARWRQLLDQAPDAAKMLTQVVVDNPGPLTLACAGSIVTGKILLNAVRPRGPVEALATIIIATALASAGTAELMRRGILKFQVRDESGCLVPPGS